MQGVLTPGGKAGVAGPLGRVACPGTLGEHVGRYTPSKATLSHVRVVLYRGTNLDFRAGVHYRVPTA